MTFCCVTMRADARACFMLSSFTVKDELDSLKPLHSSFATWSMTASFTALSSSVTVEWKDV